MATKPIRRMRLGNFKFGEMSKPAALYTTHNVEEYKMTNVINAVSKGPKGCECVWNWSRNRVAIPIQRSSNRNMILLCCVFRHLGGMGEFSRIWRAKQLHYSRVKVFRFQGVAL
jgi:hypothetical protein